MRKPSRLIRVVLVVLSLFVVTSSFAPKAEAGLFDFFKKKNSVEENTEKSIKALLESEEEGRTSNEVLVNNFGDNTLTWAFLNVAGPPSDDSVVMKNLSEEEKRIVYEKYGGGAIGEVGSAVALMYHAPASSTTYVADLLESAHIVPQAQAQGLGFASLDPILETWKVFRNIAYLFFVIIFLVIGFMIMFRQKIGGQTVVTAQQAIPKVIISLIAVTFSYAIAGFLIDLMYIMMYLLIGAFQPAEGAGILGKDFIRIGFDLITGNRGLNSSVFSTTNEAVKEFASAIVADAGDTIAGVFGWIGGLTVALIVSIAVLIGIFKMFFELLKTYISIIILIATAPISLMLNALPGQNNFGDWVRNVFGQLLTFPLVLFALILFEMFTATDLEAGGFLPPFMIGRGSGGAIMALVGIGIILIIPELIQEMKKALKVDGGIWETLGVKAVDRAREGAPIGATIAGTGLGLVGGGVEGLGKAAWRTRGMSMATPAARRARAIKFLQETGYVAGDRAATGGRVLKGLAGGKTPEALKPLEDAIDKGSQFFSQDQYIERLRKGGGMFKSGIESSMSREQREKMAKAEADKAEFERARLQRGEFGQFVSDKK